jgi:hypothetical protein
VIIEPASAPGGTPPSLDFFRRYNDARADRSDQEVSPPLTSARPHPSASAAAHLPPSNLSSPPALSTIPPQSQQPQQLHQPQPALTSQSLPSLTKTPPGSTTTLIETQQLSEPPKPIATSTPTPTLASPSLPASSTPLSPTIAPPLPEPSQREVATTPLPPVSYYYSAPTTTPTPTPTPTPIPTPIPPPSKVENPASVPVPSHVPASVPVPALAPILEPTPPKVSPSPPVQTKKSEEHRLSWEIDLSEVGTPTFDMPIDIPEPATTFPLSLSIEVNSTSTSIPESSASSSSTSSSTEWSGSGMWGEVTPAVSSSVNTPPIFTSPSVFLSDSPGGKTSAGGSTSPFPGIRFHSLAKEKEAQLVPASSPVPVTPSPPAHRLSAIPAPATVQKDISVSPVVLSPPPVISTGPSPGGDRSISLLLVDQIKRTTKEVLAAEASQGSIRDDHPTVLALCSRLEDFLTTKLKGMSFSFSSSLLSLFDLLQHPLPDFHFLFPSQNQL